MKQLTLPCRASCIYLHGAFPSTAKILQRPARQVRLRKYRVIGISTVMVNYARPVKGREVWGKLVEYGWTVQPFGLGTPSPWRAGANEIDHTLLHEVKVEGRTVPAGVYGLAFVVNRDNTGSGFIKRQQGLGTFFYEAKNDQLRAPIKLNSIPFTEMLTYDFIDLKNSATLVLNWKKKHFVKI